MILNPIFYNIGNVGIDFSLDNSSETTVLGGWWAFSPNAIGFKSNGWKNLFIGCQLEMGSNARGFELGPGSSYNLIMINNNHAKSSIDEGVYNYINNGGYVVSSPSSESGTTTVANGEWISHGLPKTPSVVLITPRNTDYGGVTFTVACINRNTTHFQVGVKWTNGTAITNDVIQIDWYAEV
jgi:hypothetical protein